MKQYYIYFLSIILSSAFLSSCSKDNMDKKDPVIAYQKIGESFAIGAATKVEVYANGNLTTGYNNLYLALYDSVSNKKIEQAQISIMPMMDMGTMKHSSPAENPSQNSTENKLFPGAAVFTMPSGDMGSWALNINASVAGKQGMLSLPVTVANTPVARVKSFVSKVDGSIIYAALIQPATPKIGINDMEIAVYKKKSMMEFPADSSLTVTLTPEMPTMGHGSPNNVNPVHISKGHYKGKVNFTMTGLWYLNLDFYAGAAVVDDATYFEVNF